MPTFSFRAEHSLDVAEFRAILKQRGHSYASYQFKEVERHFGEVAIELTIDLTIQQLIALMQQQDDPHLMIQTLREAPMAVNRFTREYGSSR